MGRPATDIDDQVLRMRNEQCSRHFLQLLREHHGEPEEIESATEAAPAEPAIVESDYWHLMWCFDLVSGLPRNQNQRTIGSQKIEDVIRAVTQEFGVSRLDILSDRRTKKIVLPRQIVCFLAKKLTGRSYPEIGRRIGGRDHSTILVSVEKIEGMIAKDHDLKNRIDRLAYSLGGSIA